MKQGALQIVAQRIVRIAPDQFADGLFIDAVQHHDQHGDHRRVFEPGLHCHLGKLPSNGVSCAGEVGETEQDFGIGCVSGNCSEIPGGDSLVHRLTIGRQGKHFLGQVKHLWS